MSKKALVPIQLPADPTLPLEAATKQYVDALAGEEVVVQAATPAVVASHNLWVDTDDVSSLLPSEVEVSATQPTSADTELWVDTSSDPQSLVWAVYTPVLAGAGWAVGNGSLLGSTMKIGQLCYFRIILTFGSTSTYGAAVPSLSLPFPATNTVMPNSFNVVLYDATGSRYLGAMIFATTTTFYVQYYEVSGTTIRHNNVSSTIPFTWAVNDAIAVAGSYPVT